MDELAIGGGLALGVSPRGDGDPRPLPFPLLFLAFFPFLAVSTIRCRAQLDPMLCAGATVDISIHLPERAPAKLRQGFSNAEAGVTTNASASNSFASPAAGCEGVNMAPFIRLQHSWALE